MLAPIACVAIQIVGSPATPTDIEALQQRCDGVLGTDRCRVTMPEGEVNAAGHAADGSCWRATVAIADKAAAATVVLIAGTGSAATEARRDLTFDNRDQISERWVTLGLVIAALVTIEERSAAAREPSSLLPAAPAPAGSPLPLATMTTLATTDRGLDNAGGGPALQAALAGVAAEGVLPGAALGARLEALLTWTRLGALARVDYFPSRNRAMVPVANGTGGGAFQLWSAELGLCLRARPIRLLSLRGCGGGGIAAMAASGFGVAETSTASALSSTIWGGVAAETFVSNRIAVIVEPSALYALQRPAFAIRGAGTVYTPGRFGGSLAVGLAVGF